MVINYNGLFTGSFVPGKEYNGYCEQNAVSPSLIHLSWVGEVQAACLKFIK